MSNSKGVDVKHNKGNKRPCSSHTTHNFQGNSIESTFSFVFTFYIREKGIFLTSSWVFPLCGFFKGISYVICVDVLFFLWLFSFQFQFFTIPLNNELNCNIRCDEPFQWNIHNNLHIICLHHSFQIRNYVAFVGF